MTGRSMRRFTRHPMIGRARIVAGLAAAWSLGACAPAALLPYRPDQPATVTLPVALAGVGDARAAFATLFATELHAGDGTRQGPWLHGVPALTTPAPPDPGLHTRFAARAASTSVLMVTGLFGDCLGAQAVPFGDGLMRPPPAALDEGYRQYDDLGLLSIRFVQVPGRASTDANGKRLAEAIRAEAARPGVERIVLVGYSKGVPDLQHALALLQRDGGVPVAVAALVSIAGAVMGTPLADHYESAYDAVSPHVTPFDCTPSQGGDMASLTRRERVAWLAAHPLPPGLAAYSIVAHAPVAEMSPLLRVPAQWLAAADPPLGRGAAARPPPRRDDARPDLGPRLPARGLVQGDIEVGRDHGTLSRQHRLPCRRGPGCGATRLPVGPYSDAAQLHGHKAARHDAPACRDATQPRSPPRT